MLHTPGPWIQEGRYVEAFNDQKVCTFGCEVYGPEDEALADARLISAAPDLLTALVALINKASWNSTSGYWTIGPMSDHPEGTLAFAHAAIAKAKGE